MSTHDSVHWSPEEDAIIRRMLTAPLEQIAAKLPGRTTRSVSARRMRIGVILPSRYHALYRTEATPGEAEVTVNTRGDYDRHCDAVLDALGGFGLDQVERAWRLSGGTASERVCVRALVSIPT